MRPCIALIVLAFLCAAALPGEAWQPAKAPLMTKWAADVTPDKALPEYPRPQLVRKDWLNLNGLWDYAVTAKDAAAPAQYDGQILVPFPIESALSGVMKKFDQKSLLRYRRGFDVPKDWAGKRVLLHFGAVDWEAAVCVNGKELGTHRGGYDGFSVDITDALKADGKQELIVTVTDPTDAGGQPRGKQVLRPGGIFYWGTSGIWQTVWLEPVAAAHITDIHIIPMLDESQVEIQMSGVLAGAKAEIRIEGSDGVQTGSLSVAAHKETEVILPFPRLVLGVKDVKPWTPETPFLYDLKVELKSDGKTVDEVKSYFGMRKIALGKDENGIQRLMLNNKFVFQVGTLDQGFWPDGLYRAPTDEALRFDIEAHKKLGFNMLRKHVKVEPERWYYWCDKLGLLVWQDMPSGNNKTADDKKQFEVELKRLVESHWNHPSIILWVVFNEGWGQYDTERLTKWVKDFDPSRLVNNASGWTDKKCGDVIDMHAYPGPGSPKPEENRAAVLGEFGGLGLGVDGHTWTNKTWGYQGMASAKALTKRYVDLYRKVWQLKDNPGMCASVYTQITDVETECNGIYTYDRAVLKLDPETALSAHKNQFPPLPEFRVVVPTAQNDPLAWRYTTEKPAADWFKPDFDATAWKEGPAGFGTNGTPGAVVRTEWKTADIWLRREFALEDAKLKDPQFMIHHDEDAEVYVNGVLACKVAGFVSEYQEAEMTPEGKAALKPGKNIIAVHCHQTIGGQYIDVGIVDVK
ncbi:MAG: glycoside hydrolase family 2 [Planctomycetota bacterium]|nr:glycoside hydrolase family 2 [Planctomycetota bacterium]